MNFEYGQFKIESHDKDRLMEVTVPAFQMSTCDHCIMTSTAGTTGYLNDKYSTATAIKLHLGAGGHFELIPHGGSCGCDEGGFTYIVYGDAELRSLIEALNFCVESLEVLAYQRNFN